MSGRAVQVLGFLRKYIAERGVAPSYREIGIACGVNTTSLVAYWLGELEHAGYIKRYRGVARGIVLLDNESLANSA